MERSDGFAGGVKLFFAIHVLFHSTSIYYYNSCNRNDTFTFSIIWFRMVKYGFVPFIIQRFRVLKL